MIRDQVPCPARRCAQIRHILNLSNCVHPEQSSCFILGINEGWVEFCTDCNKVTDSSFKLKATSTQTQHIIELAECVHPDFALHFILGVDGNWVELCADCNKATDWG